MHNSVSRIQDFFFNCEQHCTVYSCEQDTRQPSVNQCISSPYLVHLLLSYMRVVLMMVVMMMTRVMVMMVVMVMFVVMTMAVSMMMVVIMTVFVAVRAFLTTNMYMSTLSRV